MIMISNKQPITIPATSPPSRHVSEMEWRRRGRINKDNESGGQTDKRRKTNTDGGDEGKILKEDDKLIAWRERYIKKKKRVCESH